jgi:alkanesulfonate monooxygenase SsuD/methylene tetrahydromethanopterin reductase-like flavin-dependent oxidoreductase (luciferase family)
VEDALEGEPTMTTLGYQIPNFTYEGVAPGDLFATVAAQAREADTSGFDTVMVMDHFFQLPMLGPPEREMLECYTLLGALAQHTSTARLGALVTGNTYRNPAVLAKIITTLDIVSGGRAQLGIGAGWFDVEHDAFGIEFGTFTDRFEKLEEALQIIVPMLRDERPTFEGEHYAVKRAINQPAPLGTSRS